jgi:hypothetical protein
MGDKEYLEKIVNEAFKDIEFPVYDGKGNVTLTHTDENGRRWVLMTGADNFHNAMRKAVDKMIKDLNK